VSALADPSPPRRRVRPYLLALERSRARWKAHATRARAEARSLRRQLRRLTARCQRARDEAAALRRPPQASGPEAAKNGCRS